MGGVRDDAVVMNIAQELDAKSKEAMSVLRIPVRVRSKKNHDMLGDASVISEEDVYEIRNILGTAEISAGDFMLRPDDSTPFFINKTLFENLYEVLPS